MALNIPDTLCQQFGSTLGGTAEVINGVCTVTRIRSNLRPLIQGRRTNSVLALAALFSFEDLDQRGNALNLGETVILQEEINPFITALRMQGIEVTALHNHWLFDNPRLMYIHFKSVEPPLAFAEKAAGAFRVLATQTVSPNRTAGQTSGGRSAGGRAAGTPRSWGTCNCSKTGSPSAGAIRSKGRTVGVTGLPEKQKAGKSLRPSAAKRS